MGCTSSVQQQPQQQLPQQQQFDETTILITARKKIILAPNWFAYSGLARNTQRIKVLLESDVELRAHASSSANFEAAATRAIRKAYRLGASGAARHQKDLVGGQPILDTLNGLYQHQNPSEKSILTHAVTEIALLDDADGLAAKLTEVCDRAPRCPSARKQAMELLVNHAGKLVDSSSSSSSSSNESKTYAKRRLQELKGANDKGLLTESEFSEYSSRIESRASTASPGGGHGDLGMREGALQKVHEVFGHYLDAHKERAWKSGFEEPARCYFHLVGDHVGRDHVNVHGLNWYLVALDAGLGVKLHMTPEDNDVHCMGVCCFWTGLNQAAWELFADPQNFGKDFESIKSFQKWGRTKFIARSVPSGQFPRGISGSPAQLRGKIQQQNDSVVSALGIYAERFAYFFTKEFFVKRCFENLNAENTPEYVGFRAAAAEALFEEYASLHGLSAVTSDGLNGVSGGARLSLVEHVYADEYFADFSADNAARFFGWLGLLELSQQDQDELLRLRQAAENEVLQGALPGSAAGSSAATTPVPAAMTGMTAAAGEEAKSDEEADNICPICMTEQADITPIAHVDSHGDVSGHRICSACRVAWGKNVCPFCKEVTTAAELVGFIRDLVGAVGSSHADANQSAALLERLQIFDMEHEGQPTVIKRVYQMIIEDADFAALLDRALAKREAWPRDMAGLLWRLDAAAAAGELQGLDPGARQRLGGVVEAIWKPFDRARPADLHPHYYGAFYTQALVAWLGALRTGMDVAGLADGVRRAGKALVRWKKTRKGKDTRQAKDRMHAEYMVLSHEPIWGSREQDVVWQAFFIK